MKPYISIESESQPGKKWLIALIFSFVIAIGLFLLSDSFIPSLALVISMGTTTGMMISKEQEVSNNPQMRKRFTQSLVLGIMILFIVVSLYFYSK